MFWKINFTNCIVTCHCIIKVVLPAYLYDPHVTDPDWCLSRTFFWTANFIQFGFLGWRKYNYNKCWQFHTISLTSCQNSVILCERCARHTASVGDDLLLLDLGRMESWRGHRSQSKKNLPSQTRTITITTKFKKFIPNGSNILK